MNLELFDPNEVPKQPRARYFVQRGGALADTSRGFSSKAAAGEWINGLGRRLDWRVGFEFRLRGDTVSMFIVDRQGRQVRP